MVREERMAGFGREAGRVKLSVGLVPPRGRFSKGNPVFQTVCDVFSFIKFKLRHSANDRLTKYE